MYEREDQKRARKAKSFGGSSKSELCMIIRGVPMENREHGIKAAFESYSGETVIVTHLYTKAKVKPKSAWVVIVGSNTLRF